MYPRCTGNLETGQKCTGNLKAPANRVGSCHKVCQHFDDRPC